MARALDLAERGRGETNPNPMVGCVIVKGGRLVGQAWHRRAGAPHAEVLALEQAGTRARGATLYVNLEPCAHQGRTPPCAPRLAAGGLRRVVVAARDPNPAVDGRGLARLRRSGITVTTGVMESDALLLNEPFFVAVGRRRPFVLLKAALTLDGKIATRDGDSKWITSPAQRREARRLRRLHDAVAVGIGTVLADDPRLLPRPAVHRPFHRIVFDADLRLPPDSRLARSARRSPVWAICVRPDALRRRRLEALGVLVVSARGRGGRVSLPWALGEMRRRGIWSVMVEGGSELLGSFLSQRLLDQVALFRAPLLLGGRQSRPAFGGPEPSRVADALRLTRRSPLLGRERAAEAAPPADDVLFDVWYPAR
ncbi:MAG: bifunctional diaminohydroxyphosphoribosylaminopyrimidine deaminase/5-amino-6-(5-phosphoribosylamino)uracil reductase RibD [Acidobacteria bacterium]|nr:MAG: bifunctional diaminohydroxyphosphoribosylaminopyrimidine deaminase/5-amino-6-(5-phosphoribosylamino)uracil reductase RibD [Acidobacteriota bacterium]PYQ23505.1 MAG: bifunctional diaminohydroxyphosphoribosylaminopyrimidine deaminase/5-amino-6-(5-phosphoribosylamino)uracil reductase RibD [Acidobacteriota bacterium]